MGKSAVSGPFYGAKALLWSYHRDALDSPTSTSVRTLANIQIPAYEDWFVSELRGSRQSTTASTVATFQLSDDSSRATATTRTVATVVLTSTVLGGAVLSTTPAADAGEFEGVRVAALSTLTLKFLDANSSAASLASSGLSAWIYGFIRFINSTRAEQ